uniref:Uncharacterized protein n=1 Tax=Arundo donax TaxID=35708 RepID=A0A0A9HBD0_ARUDO
MSDAWQELTFQMNIISIIILAPLDINERQQP